MGTHGQLNRSFRHTQVTFDMLLQQYQQYGFKKQHILLAWQQCKQNTVTFHDELIKISEQENAKTMNQQDLMSSQMLLKHQLKLLEENDLKRAIQFSLDSENQIKGTQQQPRASKQVPIGLKNLGNTCYMNATLQSLFNIRLFRKLIFSVNIPDNKTPAAMFLLKLQQVFVTMQESNDSAISPGAVLEGLQQYKPTAILVKGIQNDFNELLNAFLDAIESAFKDLGLEEDKKQFCQAFYGESKEILSFKENDGEIIKVAETTFGSISIEASDKDLEKGFINTRVLIVDEFETDSKQKTKAKIEQNILQSPQILSFYINRAYYDPKQKQACKNNAQFNFPTKLNINQFKISNQGEMNKELQKLNEEEQNIIDEIKSCGDSKEEMEVSFDKVIRLFRRCEGQIDQILQIDGFCICDEKTTNPNLIPSSGMIFQLETYKEKFTKRLQLLSDQLERVQEKKKKLLQTDQNIFILTAVLMHDGNANSGHYYCYVLDKNDRKTWWKCNDSTTTKVEFTQVYFDATGQNRVNCNVSGLIYEQEECLKIEIVQVDSKLKEQVLQSKEQQQIKQDKDLIFSRKQAITDLISGIQQRKPKSQDRLEIEFEKYTYFDLYLFFTNAQLHQYYVSINTIKSELEKVKGQLLLPHNYNLYLEQFIKESNLIQKDYQNEIKQLEEDFKKINSLLQQLPVKDITHNNYQEKIQYYCQVLLFLSQNQNYQSTFQAVKEIYQALLLKGCFFVDLLIQTKNINSVTQTAQVILSQVTDNKFVDNILVKQIKQNLETSAEQLKLITKRNEIIELMTKLKSKVQISIILRQLPYKQLDQDLNALQVLRRSGLNLWLQQLSELLNNNKLLDQQERLKQEEIHYFE